MTPTQLLGQSCYMWRVDSPGRGAVARIDRVQPELPFPIHISWERQGTIARGEAWVLPIEIEPARFAL